MGGCGGDVKASVCSIIYMCVSWRILKNTMGYHHHRVRIFLRLSTLQ